MKNAWACMTSTSTRACMPAAPGCRLQLRPTHGGTLVSVARPPARPQEAENTGGGKLGA